MKTYFLFGAFALLAGACNAQKLKDKDIPSPVKTSFQKNYASATHVTWEKENGNYEGNWGGKSGEDNSVMYSPAGVFIEYVKAIRVSELPKNTLMYLRTHYKNVKVTEAGKVTDAKGKICYEAEVNRKDVLFDSNGNFIQVEN